MICRKRAHYANIIISVGIYYLISVALRHASFGGLGREGEGHCRPRRAPLFNTARRAPAPDATLVVTSDHPASWLLFRPPRPC